MPQEVAFVTGARGGIGAAVVTQLIDAGYRVAAFDQRPPLSVEPHQSRLDLVGDVADSAAVEEAFARCDKELGGLTAVVSCAGILRPATLAETTDDDWSYHMAVNATGPFNVLRSATYRLVSQGTGSVVVISSNTAHVPRIGMAAYGAGKAAATALTRTAALELARHHIRCNAIEPGSVDTPMQRDLWADPEVGTAAAIDGDPGTYRIGIPLGRIAQPADVASLVTFLLSDRAKHITMQRIGVDGGASL